MFKNLSIGTRMIAGSGVLIIIFSSLIFLGISRMKSLSDLTDKMYRHPLTVSNAVLRVHTNIIKIHHTMKDVVLTKDAREIKRISTIVDSFEEEIYSDFDIIAERFLGSKAMYEETLALFTQWKPIRDKIIDLMHEQKRSKAAAIIMGKGALHVVELERSIFLLENFAQEKASEFLANTLEIKGRSVRMMFFLIIVTTLFSVIFIFFLTRSIMNPLSALKKSIAIIGQGNLDTAVNIKSGGEIAELARDFDNMRLQLKGSYSNLENEVAEKTRELAHTLGNIRDHNIQLVSTQNAMLNLVEDLEDSKTSLEKEIHERINAEYSLQKAHNNLEKRVEDRTYELRKVHEQLRHAEKLSAIGGLSASIAHEFNNPLQGVMTVINGIRQRVPLEEDDAELIDMAIHECRRMRDLIKSLQDFNRPTSGRVAPMDIHTTIDSILLLSKKEFKNKKIGVEIRFAKDVPEIQAVSDQIKQVLLNLLNNALYACENGDSVIIKTEAGKDDITIHIQDTGCGIKPEFVDHLFEPFFTTKPEVKGTGLGLSVSYGIIKEHGGKIEVESEPGQGTTFSITLPIKDTNGEQQEISEG